MKLRDLAKRSARNLKNAKLRTILTALAIAVGGFTLCLTLAAGNGVRKYTENLVSSNFDPAELIVGRDPEITNTGTPSEKPKEYDESITSFQGGDPGSSLQIIQVTRDDIEEIEQIDGIESVRETYNLNIRYITREGHKKYTASAEAYNPSQKPEIISGNVPENRDIAAGSILLPDSYLESLGFNSPEEALGQKIKVVVEQSFSIESLQQLANSASTNGTIDLNKLEEDSFEPEEKVYELIVSAVTRKPATSISFGPQALIISNHDAKQIYDFTTQGTANYDKYLYVSARVENGENKQIRDAVKSDLESKEYYVQSSEDIQKTITQFVDILQGIVVALGSITILASVFGIVNTQYISVLERTREIGLIKALGMSSKKVLTLFVLEAMWIGFIGGAIGIIGGYVAGLVLNPFITESLDLGEGNSLIIFSFLQIFALLVSLMTIAAVAGLLPARKAAKLDPVEALRTE